jgi:endoglucanase
VMRQDFAPLKAVELQYSIPVHIGEFGAYSRADMTSRAKWTTFLSRYFEELGWSWAYWEFSAGFGIYNPSNKTLNQELVDALLHNEMPEPGRYVGTAIYTSNFQTGNDGWNLNAQQGASAQLVRAENTLNVNITNGGTAGWHVQLQKQPFSLQTGKKYRVSFKAKAESARSMTVYLGMTLSPWSAFSGYNDITLTDTFSVYTFVFDMAAATSNARMVFDMGNSTLNISVTDIKIEEIVFEAPTGIISPEVEKLRIFPNPVKDILYYSNPENFTRVSVFSLDGKQLLDKPIQQAENSLDVSGLQPGIYFIRFAGKNKIVTEKIMKH